VRSRRKGADADCEPPGALRGGKGIIPGDIDEFNAADAPFSDAIWRRGEAVMDSGRKKAGARPA